jgi:CheY-like chemotaxis protein
MKRFLLIDDDDIICIVHPAIIRQALPDSEVEIIKSSKEALSFIQEMNENNYPAPDAIFLDINMPEISGFGLLELLGESDKEYLKDTKIYMLSSSVDQRDIERVKANPIIADFVGKPLTIDFLKQNFS